MINKGLFCIILSQIFEHLGYYSLLGNLVFLLNSSIMCWTYSNSLISGFMLSGFTYIGCLLGGLLADIFIKKTTVVIIGYILYSQYATFTMAFYSDFKDRDTNHSQSYCNQSVDNNMQILYEKNFEFVMPGVLCTALGAGFIKSVIASIGTDIVTKNRLEPSVFYNLYYWGLNLGSLLAYLIFALVQQKYSKFIGLLIPACMVCISFVIFMIGYPSYVQLMKPERSTPNLLLSVIKEAVVRRFKKPIYPYNSDKHRLESRRQINQSPDSIYVKRQINNISTLETIYGSIDREIEVRISEDDINNRSDIMIFTDDDDESEIEPAYLTALAARSGNKVNEETDSKVFPNVTEVQDSKLKSDKTNDQCEEVAQPDVISPSPVIIRPNFLDRAKIRFGGIYPEEDVENVRKLLNVTALTFCLIPYWIAYFQMTTTYFNQGIHMNLHIAPNFNLPVAYLTVTDILLVMFAIPIFVHFLYPCLAKRNWKPGFHWRIVFGMLLASLSILVAGFVEKKREDSKQFNQTIRGETYKSRDVSIFLQVPQFMIMGTSEVMTIVSGLEMACSMVPKSMQGLSNAVFYFVSGLSSFIAGGIVQILQTSFQKESKSITDSFMPKMDIYFFIIAILPFVGTFIFMIVYSCLSINKDKEDLDFSVPYSSVQNHLSDEEQLGTSSQLQSHTA